MCKRKDNLEKIKKYQVEVNFRLDYYSRPGSLGKIFEKMPKDMDYNEYKPTEEELQIIGYDDAARCLQRSLTELMFYSCKVLKSKDGNRDVTIYIHRNFVSLQTNTSSSEKNDEIIEFVKEIFQFFLNDSDFNIEDISCRVTFSAISVNKGDVWSVFDKTAFPILDDAKVISGIYQDTHHVSDFFIDLIRNISSNEDGTIDGVISSTAICAESPLRERVQEKDLGIFLSEMVSESIGEVTRCFTE